MELPDVWTTFGIGLGLVGLAVGMTAVPSSGHAEFRLARVCFAVAVIIFEGKLIAWGVADQNSSTLIIVALAGALLSVGLVKSFSWVNEKQSALQTSSAPHTALPVSKPSEILAAPTAPTSNSAITVKARAFTKSLRAFQDEFAKRSVAEAQTEFTRLAQMSDILRDRPQIDEQIQANLRARQEQQDLLYDSGYKLEATNIRDSLAATLRNSGIFPSEYSGDQRYIIGAPLMELSRLKGPNAILRIADYLDMLSDLVDKSEATKLSH